MMRGEIWTVAGGGEYGGKPRPAAIIQDDRFAETNSIALCLITSDPTDVALVRVVVEPTATNGLQATSRLMVDKIVTVPRNRLGRRIGELASNDIAGLNQALIVFLGLSATAPEAAATTSRS